MIHRSCFRILRSPTKYRRCSYKSSVSDPKHTHIYSLQSLSRGPSNNSSIDSIYYFSSTVKKSSEEENVSKSENDASAPDENHKEKDKSLFDTINRIKSETSGDRDDKENAKKEENKESTNDIVYNIKQHIIQFQDSLIETWHELLESGKSKGIQERVKEAESLKKQKNSYKGTTELMIIDEDENLGAWEKMQRRLSSAPIIQSMLGKSYEMFEKSGGKELQKKLKDVKHDAEEVWETSQNPWVYRVSSVYDTLTAESEFATATRLLRIKDPSFSMETFLNDCIEHTLPEVMKWILTNNIDALEPYLGESVYHRLDAEMTARLKEKLVLDSNLLGIFNAEIITAQVDAKNDYGEKEPILLVHYMAQQINCVRDEEGNVVQGKEDEIKANSYLVAFQREIVEEDGGLMWKIVDFRFNGAIAWI